MLGIIIGTAAVIAIMTVGNGLSSSVVGNMSSLGANNVTLFVQSRNEGSQQADMQSMLAGSTINSKDLISSAVINKVKTKYTNQISKVSISENDGTATAKKAKHRSNFTLLGVNENYFSVQNIKMKTGRSVSKADNSGTKKVAVISDKAVKYLFKGNSKKATGSDITLKLNGKTYKFHVIGVYKYEANSMQMSQSNTVSDKNIATYCYIPAKTGKDITGNDSGYYDFTVKTKASVDSKKFADSASKFLNHEYYRGNSKCHIAAISMDTMLSTMKKILSKINLALAIIAGISLLVGGIGVMNIMLVSVTERTREIGIRKALGATNGSIRMQFALQSIILCLIGGGIGVALGILLGAIGSSVIGFKMAASAGSIVISLGVAFAIGIFFGLYPAGKAAKLDPINALRYE